MKDLMTDVFNELYEKDANILGQIIKDYGYDVSSEEKLEEPNFEAFMDKLEKNAKKNNIEMKGVLIWK